MKKMPSETKERSESSSGWIWICSGLLLALVLVLLVRPRGQSSDLAPGVGFGATGMPMAAATSSGTTRSGPSRHRGSSEASAEEIVARKLSEFSKRRRAVVHAIAKQFNLEVPT